MWFTYVEVKISGKAVKGSTPMSLTLELYDNGLLVSSTSETGISIGAEYTTSLELGSPNGNEAGVDLGEHTLQGKLLLRNAQGEVEYMTETVTIGIGQVPRGGVT